MYGSICGDPVDHDSGVSVVYIHGDLMDEPSGFLSGVLGQVYCLSYCCLVVHEDVDLVVAESILV
jgi:hypothetical protein